MLYVPFGTAPITRAVIRAFGVSDKGRRTTNEDCFAVDEALGLFVIADGMGGHNAGEVAARLAVDTVVDVVGKAAPSHPFGYDDSLSSDGNLLRTGIHLAHARILDASNTVDRYAGMGTTLVAARVAGGRLSVAHVGDSRLYVLVGGHLRQVTRDDSWMASVLAHDPDANAAVLQRHPMRNALTNVVGAGPRTDVHVTEQPLAGVEMLLLTTDGVHGALDAARIEQLLRDDDDPRVIAGWVVAAAVSSGSFDNCTAVVVGISADGA